MKLTIVARPNFSPLAGGKLWSSEPDYVSCACASVNVKVTKLIQHDYTYQHVLLTS